MTPQCPRCGRPHQAGERYCARCGMDLAPPPWLAGGPPVGGPGQSSPGQGRPADPTTGWEPLEQTTLRTPTTPPTLPPPQRRGGVAGLVIGIVVAVTLIGGAVTGLWFLSDRGSGAATSGRTETQVVASSQAATSTPASPATARSSADPTPVSVTSSSPSPSPPTVPALDPLTELQRLRDDGVARLTLDGHWVVQLASKYEGVVDATQTALDGSHTFHNDDILAEHMALKARFGGAIKLISGIDMGKRSTRPQALWMTIYDPGTFGSQAAAASWCRTAFPGLSGSALDNVCLTRQAKPPYD